MCSVLAKRPIDRLRRDLSTQPPHHTPTPLYTPNVLKKSSPTGAGGLALAGVPPDAPLDPTEPVDAADTTLTLLVDRLCADPGAVAAASASLPPDNDMPLTDEAADPVPLPFFPRVDEEGSADASSNTSADMLRPLPVKKKVVRVSCLDRRERDVGKGAACVVPSLRARRQRPWLQRRRLVVVRIIPSPFR